MIYCEIDLPWRNIVSFHPILMHPDHISCLMILRCSACLHSVVVSFPFALIHRRLDHTGSHHGNTAEMGSNWRWSKFSPLSLFSASLSFFPWYLYIIPFMFSGVHALHTFPVVWFTRRSATAWDGVCSEKAKHTALTLLLTLSLLPPTPSAPSSTGFTLQSKCTHDGF